MAERMMRRVTSLRCVFALGAALALLSGGGARAQLTSLLNPAGGASSNAPVTFLADQVAYDKTGNIVTAEGHVRAWQDGQTLYADKIVINRNTNVATATGHVILTEPNGQTVFADNAVLSNGMKNAVMQGVSARLAENARMIANGAQRYDNQIDEMTKVVYSSCDLCKSNPTAPPLWQIRATSATRDLQHKMIEYRNAEMEVDGIPVFYLPFMTQPDPSVKRQTGLLIPGAGSSSHIGFFVTLPYYIVLDPESDVTLTPVLAVKQGPVLDAKYRRAFNNGIIHVDLSGGLDHGTFGNSIFSDGTFDLSKTWRAGFTYNHASNPTYLNDFNILPNAAFLTSNVYVEGFAPGSYARLDSEFYQGLVTSINQSELPVVAPHGQYSFVSDPDSLGGRVNLSADTFQVFRNVGTDTKRISTVDGYSLPFAGPLGQVWTARVQFIAASYNASKLDQQPNYSTINSATTSRAQAYGALFMRWPFIRSAGTWGSQIVEPEVQFLASPLIGTTENYRIPNEDSLDLEFSDANLFDFNRYPGIDRLPGGERVDYALHSAWYLPGGALVDGIAGQSYQVQKTNVYLPLSGLTDNVSDYVGRITVAPSPFFSVTYRTRLNHTDFGVRMLDATATAGNKLLTLSGGYLYSNTNPYVLYLSPPIPSDYYTPREEFTANAASSFGPWTLTAGTERNLQTGSFDSASFAGGWQNECTAVNVIFYQRYTSFNNDEGSTTLLIQFTFKTLGNVGFSAL